MNLKAILLLPETKKLSEKVLREINLQLAKDKPEVFIFVLPEGHIFTDAISLDYQSPIKIGNKDFESDFYLQEEYSKKLEEFSIPFLLLNPERLENYSTNLFIPKCLDEYVSLLNKTIPEFKVCLITPGGLTRSNLIKAGALLTQTINENNKNCIIISFTDLNTSGDIIKNALRFGEFLNILKLKVSNKNLSLYNSLIMAIGATDSLQVISYLYGDTKAESALLRLSDKNKQKSLIKSYLEFKDIMQRSLLESEKPLDKMVRKTIKAFTEDGKVLKLEDFKDDFDRETFTRLHNQRTGVFVTVYKEQQPRGSMGTIHPLKENLGEEIIANAIEACFYDPNFDPIIKEEIPELTFEIDILSPLSSVEDEKELNPDRYGIVIEQGSKRGIVLPGLDGIKSVKEQIDLAKARAGITDIEKEEPIIIDKFELEEI